MRLGQRLRTCSLPPPLGLPCLCLSSTPHHSLLPYPSCSLPSLPSALALNPSTPTLPSQGLLLLLPSWGWAGVLSLLSALEGQSTSMRGRCSHTEQGQGIGWGSGSGGRPRRASGRGGSMLGDKGQGSKGWRQALIPHCCCPCHSSWGVGQS